MGDRWQPILAKLRERFPTDTDQVEVANWLSSEGYDGRQIGEILSLLYADTVAWPDRHATDGARDAALREGSLRVQGPHERGRFTAEAWGYLMTLHASGAVNVHDFEHLVERALSHVDGRIGLTEIRALAEDVGFDDGAMGGDRPLLH